MADETTTTPVQSPDLKTAVVTLLNTLAQHEAVETSAIQAALTQHQADQQTIQADETTIQGDATQLATTQAALTESQKNAVTPDIISSIDAATNALLTGQPLAPPAVDGAATT